MTVTEIKQPEATRERLLALAESTRGAWVGLKIAALLLMIEGQRPGWISEVLGLTRMSLNRWVRAVNAVGVDALKDKSRPGRPALLTAKLSEELENHLGRSPQEFVVDYCLNDAFDFAVA